MILVDKYFVKLNICVYMYSFSLISSSFLFLDNHVMTSQNCSNGSPSQKSVNMIRKVININISKRNFYCVVYITLDDEPSERPKQTCWLVKFVTKL